MAACYKSSIRPDYDYTEQLEWLWTGTAISSLLIELRYRRATFETGLNTALNVLLLRSSEKNPGENCGKAMQDVKLFDRCLETDSRRDTQWSTALLSIHWTEVQLFGTFNQKRDMLPSSLCVFGTVPISNIVSPIFHFLSAKAFYQSIHSNHSLKHTTGNATSLFFNEIPLKTRLQSLPSGLSLKCWMM